MKKQELIKIIELVVRKEVKKQANEIFIKENKETQDQSQKLHLNLIRKYITRIIKN